MAIKTKKSNLIEIIKKRQDKNKSLNEEDKKQEVWNKVKDTYSKEHQLEWIKDSLSLSKEELDFYNNNKKILYENDSMMKVWRDNM